jgi:hypothetical protein
MHTITLCKTYFKETAPRKSVTWDGSFNLNKQKGKDSVLKFSYPY